MAASDGAAGRPGRSLLGPPGAGGYAALNHPLPFVVALCGITGPHPSNRWEPRGSALTSNRRHT